MDLGAGAAAAAEPLLHGIERSNSGLADSKRNGFCTGEWSIPYFPQVLCCVQVTFRIFSLPALVLKYPIQFIYVKQEGKHPSRTVSFFNN